MVAENALETKRFAEGKPIKLITGDQLQSLVSEAQSTQKERLVIQQAVMEVSKAQLCPRCSSTLVLRTAKRGENSGNQFYGCDGFPKCRYTKDVSDLKHFSGS